MLLKFWLINDSTIVERDAAYLVPRLRDLAFSVDIGYVNGIVSFSYIFNKCNLCFNIMFIKKGLCFINSVRRIIRVL